MIPHQVRKAKVYSWLILTKSIVRKAHNSGRNHLSNVQEYYACEHFGWMHMLCVANLTCLKL